MKLYNTLTKNIEVVEKESSSAVGVYACGPTVYDFAHIGHARKYSMDDILIRVLRQSGFAVKHVMNITDVGHLVSDGDTGEDKMEKGARKTGKTVWEVAQFFEEDFWRKADLLNLKHPDVAPRATEHIAEQIAQVQQLEAKGFTYTVPGDGIYFDTSKDPEYGKLAGLDLENQKAGARLGEESVENKRNPSDFALWKFSPNDPSEKRQMEWESPWGVGFPGWHIECSAMSIKYLGEQFAIHTGGIDHIPVHHTNEIAQAENATGKKPFVKIWVHHNFLRVDGQKMSKSLENFYTLDDIIAKGSSPMALKLLFLSAHYRDELNFTWDSLAGSQKAWERMQRKLSTLLASAFWADWAEVPEFEAEEAMQRVRPEARRQAEDILALLQDDLKTPQALAQFWGLLKKAEPGDLPAIKQVLDLFGIGLL